MTKSAIIDQISENLSSLTRKQTEIIVETVFDSIKTALLQGDKIEIRGFGNFKLKHRNQRTARNPKTGELVQVPQKRVIYFKVGKALKDSLNAK